MEPAKRSDELLIPDALWAQMEPLLPERKVHPMGAHNPRIPDRAAMNAILYVLRTGCSWSALDATGICCYSSAYRRFREWTEAGLFEAFWREGLLHHDQFKGIDWSWLVMDGAISKARALAARKRNHLRKHEHTSTGAELR